MSQFCARSVIQEVVSGVVRPDGFARNVAWTPNYNGVNSYVRIPDWKPVGEFEIEFDAHADLNNQPAAGGAWKRVLSAVPGNTSCIYTANNHWHSAYLTGVLRVDSKGDFHKLRYEGTETIQPLLFIGGHNQGDIIKGQISNLKLIDKTNPDNSRFYPGIIYSDKMPDGTVLIDEWNRDVLVHPEAVYVLPSGLKQWEIIASFTDYQYNTGGLFCLEVEANGLNKSLNIRLGDGTIVNVFNGSKTHYIIVPTGGSNRHYLQETSVGSPNTGATVKVKIIKATHGIMYNFGSSEPYVRLEGGKA